MKKIIKRIIGVISVILLLPFFIFSVTVGFLGEVLKWISEKIEAVGSFGLLWIRVVSRLIRNWVWE